MSTVELTSLESKLPPPPQITPMKVEQVSIVKEVNDEEEDDDFRKVDNYEESKED